MKITTLKTQVKNPDRTSVFVDGKYGFSLTANEVLEHKVRNGIELDEAALKKFKKISADGKLRLLAYAWLMSRPRSTRQLQEYLRRKKVDPELSKKLVDQFVASGVLDEERFGEWAADRASRRHRSRRQLQAELRQAGLDTERIVETLDNSSTDSEALRALIRKVGSRPRYRDAKAFMRYLLGRGFNYSDITEALRIQETVQGRDSEP